MSAQKSGVVPGAPAWPQVNLLPPEIRASRSLRAVKRILGLALLGVIGLAVVLHVVVAFRLSTAQDELAAAQEETQQLLAEQREYAEVPQVLGQLDQAVTARLLGTSTEILLGGYLPALWATAPAGCEFQDVALTGATPTVLAPVPPNPLVRAGTVATVTFTARSLVLPDTAAWIERLEQVENFQDAYVTAAMRTEGTQDSWAGVLYYEVTGTVEVSVEALANRFAPTEED